VMKYSLWTVIGITHQIPEAAGMQLVSLARKLRTAAKR
jgi:hypothetical protein